QQGYEVTLFARALYDNTAETEDELAFRKGEIIMVLEKNVAGNIGWWKCSLRGRQGLAPANRLALLSPAEAENICMNLGTEKDYLNNRSCQNIYQTPKAIMPPVIPIYEEMSTIYKVPLQAVPSPDKHMAQEDLDGTSSPRDPLYDIPKPSKAVEQSCTDTGNSTNTCVYDVPPCLKQTDSPVVLPRQQCPSEMDSKMSHESIEYRDKPGPMYDQLHRWPSRGRTTSRQPVKGTIRRVNKDHQRSSTVSTSSTASSSSRSSCDSLMLSSPEPEPLREVTLSQEEVSNRLLELQEAVCQSVPKLMLFVSSQWRTKEHLSQHLHQIRMATEDATDSVTCFLNFALDVRGNAQRLTDFNLQTRLLKQISIIEDSGLILQEAARTLRDLGWLLDTLAQDANQSQTPDHLERFVMVARTVPEDVKRLVSILNANGKLLFRVPAKEPDIVENISTSERSKSEPMVDSGIDESDYVQLQVGKTPQYSSQYCVQKFQLSKTIYYFLCLQKVSKSLSVNPCTPVQTSMKPSISDHCRLYFGAIQKAISVFISSLNDGQPPEKFISHSKLVIMVGQRLVNTLCSEAKNREASQEMLSVSNQLCAHLKQLAMMTKKAALDFPDKLALQEVQGIAKELAQRAQHFRMSLDV
uniref:Cas scaffold protein family member 4 n=1 Tax=Sinocyclocheilus anshuiensis TaxID=1608454 RepID=A0A671N4J7_9TELE